MGTVIFDLDGTLADTSGDLIAAANKCFRTLGHGDMLDPATDAATAFRGGRAMLRLGLSRLGLVDDDVIDSEYPRLLGFYARDIDTHTKLYPGATAAVEALLEVGYKVGICTNKPEALAETLMTRLGVRALFGSLVGADTLPQRKPDPAPYLAAVTRAGGQPARSLLVGDTETDRETARAASVPCILVTFGPDGDGVSALQPEALLPDYGALPSLVSRLIAYGGSADA
ncbi:MAG: HAD-IA family hydrolase [Pseudomonadota bacterium]